MTTTLSAKPTRRARPEGRPHCPRWCTRIHDEKRDETVMHASAPIQIEGIREPGTLPGSGVTLQLNHILDDTQAHLYIAGGTDLVLGDVQQLRDRLNQAIILLGGELEGEPLQALVEAALGPTGEVTDIHAHQALQALADRMTSASC